MTETKEVKLTAQGVRKVMEELRRRFFDARRKERRAEHKAVRRAMRSTVRLGYQCPRCWAWFATPAERAAHRPTHHKQEA